MKSKLGLHSVQNDHHLALPMEAGRFMPVFSMSAVTPAGGGGAAIGRKGGDRFSVGSCSRCTPGQADDAANKAKEYQFESLHKTHFYDAWRWNIELNQPESPLRLPPRPGLLQNGCYWRQQHMHPADATDSHNTQEAVALAEISLTDTNLGK